MPSNGFQSWKATQNHAYIFLDSVDEAKLIDPRDFDLALRRLGRELGGAKERSTIVITSRPTFQPKSELQLFNQHLPCGDSKVIEEVEEEPKNGFMPKTNQSKTTTTKSNKAVIFSLVPLSFDQIKIYSAAKGAQNIDAFINAIERSDIKNFTARPRDLDGIVSGWNANGRIGTKLDVMKANIERRVEEADPNRDQINPLTNEKALQGVEAIAAVCTLTSHSRIAVPDKDLLLEAVSIGKVLPGWNLAEQQALLQRPIFDDAAYGTVRFHDREIREFLTAEWIRKLLRTGSRQKIESLFFHT